jgi:hypothetical protein
MEEIQSRVSASGDNDFFPRFRSNEPLRIEKDKFDIDLNIRWAQTLERLAQRLAEMNFTQQTLAVDETDLARFGAQAGRALLEVVIRAGGGLPQPTMTGAVEVAQGKVNITMHPDDPALYQLWVDRVKPPFLSVVCCWGSTFRGLEPGGRDVDRLRQFWSQAGMVILASQLPDRFASVDPGARDFPRCEPTARDEDGRAIFTYETEKMPLAERTAWRASQARDWAEACRAVADAVRKLGDTNANANKDSEQSRTLSTREKSPLSTDALDRILVVEDDSDEVYLRWWMEKILPADEWARFTDGMFVGHANGRPAGDLVPGFSKTSG